MSQHPLRTPEGLFESQIKHWPSFPRKSLSIFSPCALKGTLGGDATSTKRNNSARTGRHLCAVPLMAVINPVGTRHCHSFEKNAEHTRCHTDTETTVHICVSQPVLKIPAGKYNLLRRSLCKCLLDGKASSASHLETLSACPPWNANTGTLLEARQARTQETRLWARWLTIVMPMGVTQCVAKKTSFASFFTFYFFIDLRLALSMIPRSEAEAVE